MPLLHPVVKHTTEIRSTGPPFAYIHCAKRNCPPVEWCPRSIPAIVTFRYEGGGGGSPAEKGLFCCQRRRKKEKKKPRPTSAQKTSVFFSAFAHAVCRHIHLPRMLALTIITESHSPSSPLRFVCVCPAQPMTSRPPPRGRAVHATLRPNWTCVAAHTFEKHRLCLICRPSSHRTNTAKCSLSRADGRRYRTPLWKALLDTSTGAWAGKTRDGGVLTPAEWPAQPVVSVPSRPASHTTYARAKHQPPPPRPEQPPPASQSASSELQHDTTRHDTMRRQPASRPNWQVSGMFSRQA